MRSLYLGFGILAFTFTSLSLAVTFGNSKKPSDMKGLFDSHTDGSPTPRPVMDAGKAAAGAAAPSGPVAPVPGSLPGYGIGVSRSDAAKLIELQKVSKRNLGEWTTKLHVQAANCIFAAPGESDPTAKMADGCLERASSEFSRTLLSSAYPAYALQMNQAPKGAGTNPPTQKH